MLHVVHQAELARIGWVTAAHLADGSIEVRCPGCRFLLARRPNECQQQDAADTKEVGLEQGIPKARKRPRCESGRSAEDESDVQGTADDRSHAASTWVTRSSSWTATSDSIACSFMAWSIS